MRHQWLISCLLFLFMNPLCGMENTTDKEKGLKEIIPVRGKIKLLVEILRDYRLENPAKAIVYGDMALQILTEFPDTNAKLEILNDLALAHINAGNYADAYGRLQEAKELARKSGNKKKLAVALNYEGRLFAKTSDYEQAIPIILEAVKLFEELKYRWGIATAYDSLATTYTDLKNFELAEHYYSIALGIMKELKSVVGTAYINNNMGRIYEKSGRYQRALLHYKRTLASVDNLGDQQLKHMRAVCIGNIASVYNKTDKQKLSLQYNLEALGLLREIGSKPTIAISCKNLSLNYLGLKDYDKARITIEEALDIAVEVGVKPTIRDCYEVYARIHQARENYRGAFQKYRVYKQLNDEINNNNFALAQIKFEAHKKDKQIDKARFMRNYFIIISILVLIIALVSYFRYRTKKKAEKALKRSNNAKDRLFTIIAHDLGNPLNSLLLSSTHLEKRFDRLDRDDVKEFVHSIYTQTTGMSSLLQNLMEWAVSQLGKMECKPGEVNLKQLTAETIRQMKYTAEKKDIDISATVRENTYAWADKHMMKAVLRNLVSNALKFTYPGGKIDICAQDSGNGIEVAVSDNGVGMEQTRIEGLFKSEFHQSTRGTGDEKGTGLGLSLCKEFVEKNGGEIRVESQPGKGSCFSFTLPNPDAKQKQNKQNENK